MLNNYEMNCVPPSQAVGKKRGRGWTRTIDPLITYISRSATKATRPCRKNHLSSQTGG